MPLRSTYYSESVVGQVFVQRETAQIANYGILLGKRTYGTFRRDDGETCTDWTGVIATGHAQEVRINARQKLSASSWLPLPAEEMEAMFGPQILALLNQIKELAATVSELSARDALAAENAEKRIAALEQANRDITQSVRKLLAAQAEQPTVSGVQSQGVEAPANSAPPQPAHRRRG